MSAATKVDGYVGDATASFEEDEVVSSVYEHAPSGGRTRSGTRIRVAVSSSVAPASGVSASVVSIDRARRDGEADAARHEAEMEDRRRRACARIIVRRMRPSV